MRAADAVVRRRHGGSRVRRVAVALATAVMWGAYLALWAPLVQRLADRRGSWPAEAAQARGVGSLLWVLGASVALSTALICWAEYNRLRFTGVERRHRPDDVAAAEVAAFLGAEPDVADALQAADVAWVAARADGSVLSVRRRIATGAATATGRPPVPSPRPPADPATTSEPVERLWQPLLTRD